MLVVLGGWGAIAYIAFRSAIASGDGWKGTQDLQCQVQTSELLEYFSVRDGQGTL